LDRLTRAPAIELRSDFMRLASAAGALLCASVLLLSGCSSSTPDESAQTSSATQQVDGPSSEQHSDAATDAVGDVATGESTDTSAVTDPEPTADGDGADISTALADMDALFGEGGCMEVANVMMGWGFALLGPLMEGKTLSQEDADALFAATDSIPAEIEPHIAVLRTAIDAAVGQPQSKVVEIVGSPEVTDAMNGLTTYSDSVCGGDESAG
jgi:hypothetical protein